MDNTFLDIHWTNLLIIPGMLLGFTVHELGHALTAYYLGDHSQVAKGNVSLNPLKHASMLGAFAFILTGYFGWPKPLQVDPRRLRKQYLSLFFVALAGPLASLTLSLMSLLVTLVTAAGLIYISNHTSEQVLALFFPIRTELPETFNLQAVSIALTGYVVISSFWLACTSLLPLPGFDGFTAIASLIVLMRQRNSKTQPKPTATVETQPLNTSSLKFKQYKHRNNIAEMHFQLGIEYHDKHLYDDAIARYRQATRNYERFGPAYVNMGLAYLAKGRRKDAIHAFRGAIQFADDQKSQEEAWQQLHQLSEVSPTNENVAKTSMAQMGADPWTDTTPKPNWLILTVGGGTLLLFSLSLYIYIVSQFVMTLAQ